MTKQEWLTCKDPVLMLTFLRGRVSPRKLRLFACGCCRRAWPLVIDPRSRHALEVAERCADGLAGEEERLRAWEKAYTALTQTQDKWRAYATPPYEAAAALAEAVYSAVSNDLDRCIANVLSRVRHAARALAQSETAQAAEACILVRDVFDNLWLPSSLSPSLRSWKTADVIGVARDIYVEHDFDTLPILADALEDAGCTNATILGHLRDPGPHVRGCWLLDAILGKE